MNAIIGISGTQYLPGTEEFQSVKYQYAMSSYEKERNLNPALIIQPKTKKDVMLALSYAKKKKVAVAIKTGGHQYSGASSTSAPNIQLDLRNTFRGEEDRSIFEKNGKTYIRTSISWSLGEFNSWLTEHNLFVPHGQCVGVHLGGHVQTGGFGQSIRSFGLFGDHILSFEIIDYNGKSREITKKKDPDLFWAFLGGSPGNFGVLTHFTAQVYRDEDYKGSTGMKAIYLYDKKTLKRLVDILTEMSDDENCPRNYDFCISILSSAFPFLDLGPGLDKWMAREHPESYGTNGAPFWPRIIVVYAQWVPLNGGDVCDMSWFERIKEGSGFTVNDSTIQEKPMSQLMRRWIFGNPREFQHPYIKRTYNTRSRTLTRDGWADWFVNRVDAIIGSEMDQCWLSAQIQFFGGKNSMFARNEGNGTSYTWRDTTMCCIMDCFHTEEAKALAEDWQKVNDEGAIGPNGIFSKEDRRALWGSYGDWDLDANWNLYYEDRAKYEKLQRIRRAADPHGIFTPNPFSVKRADWSLCYLMSRLTTLYNRITA
ncbi:hypothetical protein AAE478_004140 [Parahypoxylon ruwenzoriense]